MGNEKAIKVLKTEIDYLERLKANGRATECIPSGETSGIAITDLIDALNLSVRMIEAEERDY